MHIAVLLEGPNESLIFARMATYAATSRKISLSWIFLPLRCILICSLGCQSLYVLFGGPGSSIREQGLSDVVYLDPTARRKRCVAHVPIRDFVPREATPMVEYKQWHVAILYPANIVRPREWALCGTVAV